METPRVSVIVPTYQRADALAKTLSALVRLDYPLEALEILVVDDGSADSTAATVATFARVRYARQPNSGVAIARNHGARLATGEVLLFVDDDIVVARDNLRRHLATRELYGECVVAGYSEFAPEVRAGLARSSFGRFRLWCEDLVQRDEASRWGTEGRVEVPTLDTQNMSIGRDLFWELGGFDERFPVGAEDQDLCWRARAGGAAIVRDYGIQVLHNDRHLDLRSLCHREERGAIGIVYLSRKHPDFPAPAGLALNGPIQRGDTPRIAARKVLRDALTLPVSLALAHRLVLAVELCRPRGGWPLHHMYRAITGLYVFRGIRRGLRLTTGETWSPGHAAEDHPLIAR